MASSESKQLMSTGNLPNDLIAHMIFPRLPAKSLARFKCVSKLWLNTISDPEPNLAKSHLLHQTPGRANIQEGSILYFTNSSDDDTEFYKINLSDIIEEWFLLPIKSCNGLLLIRGERGCSWMKHYIVNPITGRYAKLPSIVPFKDCFMHFDNVSNQYKVLGWNANRYDMVSSVCVLVFGDCNVETGISWKEIEAPDGLIMMWYPPALFNGCYHWIVSQRSNEEWAILAFNIESGKFRVMEIPNTAHMLLSDGWNYRLVMENESVYLIQHHCCLGKNYCYILWSLEDYKQQIWTVISQYRVEYCEQCKESGWDNRSSASTTLFDVKEIINEDPQYYSDVVHTNSLVWLDIRL